MRSLQSAGSTHRDVQRVTSKPSLLAWRCHLKITFRDGGMWIPIGASLSYIPLTMITSGSAVIVLASAHPEFSGVLRPALRAHPYLAIRGALHRDRTHWRPTRVQPNGRTGDFRIEYRSGAHVGRTVRQESLLRGLLQDWQVCRVDVTIGPWPLSKRCVNNTDDCDV